VVLFVLHPQGWQAQDDVGFVPPDVRILLLFVAAGLTSAA
jgi:hypothetical protein